MIFILYLEMSPISKFEVAMINYLSKLGEVVVIPALAPFFKEPIMELDERIEYFNLIKFNNNVSVYTDHTELLKTHSWRLTAETLSYAEILDFFLYNRNLEKSDVILAMSSNQYSTLPDIKIRKKDIYEFNFYKFQSIHCGANFQELTVNSTAHFKIAELPNRTTGVELMFNPQFTPQEIINQLIKKYGNFSEFKRTQEKN